MYRWVTIINDCRDSATANRKITRVAALTGIFPSFVGIGDFAELEGAGNIIDTLDASTGQPGIIIANTAPRHGKGKKYPNGSPFCYFSVGESLIISSIQGQVLSLVKKLKLSSTLHLVDVSAVCQAMVSEGMLDEWTASQIENSQYRSFDFEPRLAAWLQSGLGVPHTDHAFHDFAEIEDAGDAIWLIDNFGNCKTTILPGEIHFAEGQKVSTKYGIATMYTRLRDVPNGALALTIGSSGYGRDRFIELVIQGQSVQKAFDLRVGDGIF